MPITVHTVDTAKNRAAVHNLITLDLQRSRLKTNMVRNTRSTTRIFFILVIVAAILGGWFANATWQVDLTAFEIPSLDEDADWIDTASVLSEQAIQFFLGWTGAGN